MGNYQGYTHTVNTVNNKQGDREVPGDPGVRDQGARSLLQEVRAQHALPLPQRHLPARGKCEFVFVCAFESFLRVRDCRMQADCDKTISDSISLYYLVQSK